MRVALFGLALLALACSSNGSTDTSTGPGPGTSLGLNGTYPLKTVDNKSLPVAFADSSLLSGELVMSDSGWSQLSVVLYKTGGSAGGDTLTMRGYWTASGSNLTFFDYGNTTAYTGTYSSAGINLTTKTSVLLSYAK
jgi:hypothetical protein